MRLPCDTVPKLVSFLQYCVERKLCVQDGIRGKEDRDYTIMSIKNSKTLSGVG